jgi:hypothetical protein
LRSLGLEQYEAAFHANAVDTDVLRDLTDQDLQKLGVLLGDRRKILRAISALDGAFAPASVARYTSLPISIEMILAAAAARASPERQEGEDYSVSPSPPPSPMDSLRRPAEMIGDLSLLSPERTTSWLTEWVGATPLRWPPNAARPMPTPSFEVSRPNTFRRHLARRSLCHGTSVKQARDASAQY